MPGEFTPDTRDDVTGWLWEGPFATLIRDAIPGIAETDLRRAREYLNACGMVVNVRSNQRGGQPQWLSAPTGTRGRTAMCTWSRQPAPASQPHRRRANPHQAGKLRSWHTSRAKTS